MSLEKSTIVRSIRYSSRRAGTRALAAVSGAAYAEYLWFRRPEPPPLDRRESRTPVGGTPFTLPVATSRADEVEVTGRVYGPEGLPVAYLVHGWGGWWQQFSNLVMPLVARGFRVVAFDAPSHGSSGAGAFGPRSTTVVEMAEAFKAVVTALGPAGVVVAHSLGAMVTTWARELGVEASGYVFIAPAVSVEPIVEEFGRMLGLGSRRRQQLAARLERHIGVPMADFDLVARARREGARLPSMLAIHDVADAETPAAGSIALTDHWPESDLLLTEGLGHRRVLWQPMVVQTAVKFAQDAARAQPIRSITSGPRSGREPSGAIV
ncbi:MAG TPA: alpha/beta fold hydrolase [Dermatophilaceae bacterium]|nr:alpha/beta fold hydrolase [Dermatophilaceae bacterium]